MKLDGEVNDMLNQLSAAEKELEKKKAEADQDMMMANMVCEAFPPSGCRSKQPLQSFKATLQICSGEHMRLMSLLFFFFFFPTGIR